MLSHDWLMSILYCSLSVKAYLEPVLPLCKPENVYGKTNSTHLGVSPVATSRVPNMLLSCVAIIATKTHAS